MKARIVRIGNSQGVRIPKPLLEEARLGDEVEIRTTRPCAVVSPDEMNRSLRTLIVAPMTRGGQRTPTRVPCRFDGSDGFVALDQLRTIDRDRVVRRAGRLEPTTQHEVLDVLGRMFAA